MRLDSSTFPVVTIEIDAPTSQYEESGFSHFEALLRREQPFILLHEKGADESAHAHAHEARKQASIWMKHNRPALSSFVKGLIQVEPSAAKRLALKTFAMAFGNAWGYPLLLVESRERALALAQDVLDTEVSDVTYF